MFNFNLVASALLPMASAGLLVTAFVLTIV